MTNGIAVTADCPSVDIQCLHTSLHLKVSVSYANNKLHASLNVLIT